MPDLDTWQAVAVALAIGLLIGAERERAKHEVGSAGIRTFALVAVIGVVSTMVPTVVAAALVGGVTLMVGIGYWRSFSADPGMTSEAAALSTLALGALTPREPALAVGIAVAIAVLLVSKDALHQFFRETVTDLELTDALKFFVAAFIVLPLLPDAPVGPYGVLVPHKIWLLVVFITGIGWVGYAATRALGSSRGLLVAGLAGGFVSATATTATMAVRTRQGVPARSALAGCLMASVATMVQLLVITSVVEPRVTARLLPAAFAGAVALLVEAWWLARRRDGPRDGPSDGPSDGSSDGSSDGPSDGSSDGSSDGQGGDDDGAASPPGRPFALLPALVLAAVITGVLFLATWMNQRYGTSAVGLASATGSLADFHAAAVAVSTLVANADLALSAAVGAIAIGLLTNTVAKLVVAMVGGGPRFAGLLLGLLLVPAATITLVGLLTASA